MCLHKAGMVGSSQPRWVAPRLVPIPRTGPISLSPGGSGSWVCAGLGFISNIFGIRKKQLMWTWCRGGDAEVCRVALGVAAFEGA